MKKSFLRDIIRSSSLRSRMFCWCEVKFVVVHGEKRALLHNASKPPGMFRKSETFIPENKHRCVSNTYWMGYWIFLCAPSHSRMSCPCTKSCVWPYWMRSSNIKRWRAFACWEYPSCLSQIAQNTCGHVCTLVSLFLFWLCFYCHRRAFLQVLTACLVWGSDWPGVLI